MTDDTMSTQSAEHKALKDLIAMSYATGATDAATETKATRATRQPRKFDRFEVYMVAVRKVDATNNITYTPVYYGGTSSLSGVDGAMRQHEFAAEQKIKKKCALHNYMLQKWRDTGVNNMVWHGLERAQLTSKAQCDAMILKWRKRAPQWPKRAVYPADAGAAERAAHPFYCHSRREEFANEDEWRGHKTCCGFHGPMPWS
jgi:hypothetical protein